MAKRILDCNASDFAKMNKKDIIEALAKCEGRTVVSEIIANLSPILGNVSNPEFVASMGADIILLNMFDVINPQIKGMPDCDKKQIIRELKRLTGRLIAVNLEPVTEGYEMETDPLWAMTEGRKATIENARLAVELGIDIIVLTGNPGIGVNNKEIEHTLRLISSELGDKVVLCAGKMHAAGILSEAGENIITKENVEGFISAGADIILMPAPYTVPGISSEYIRNLITFVHSKNKLAMTAIGTSQEGADTDTIKQIALACKACGADLHHIGDAGTLGMAVPENIMAYSIAIRGIRHTYHRMATSINR